MCGTPINHFADIVWRGNIYICINYATARQSFSEKAASNNAGAQDNIYSMRDKINSFGHLITIATRFYIMLSSFARASCIMCFVCLTQPKLECEAPIDLGISIWGVLTDGIFIYCGTHWHTHALYPPTKKKTLFDVIEYIVEYLSLICRLFIRNSSTIPSGFSAAPRIRRFDECGFSLRRLLGWCERARNANEMPLTRNMYHGVWHPITASSWAAHVPFYMRESRSQGVGVVYMRCLTIW